MTQTWKNNKKPNFEPDFGPFGFFLQALPLLIIGHCPKLSSYAIYRKTNEPNLRKWQKKTNFGPDFSPFGAKCDSKIFFFMSLPLLEVKHCCRLSLYVIPRKTNEPNLRKWPKT